MALSVRDPKTGRDIDYEQVTFRNGYWFFFDDGEDEIIAHGSAWSGKEWIYFNDELVAEKRNMVKRTTTHTFEKNGSSYEVVFNFVSLLKGQLECTLYKDGKRIGYDQRIYHAEEIEFDWKKSLVGLIPFFIGGFVGGYLMADVFIPFFEKFFG